MTACRRLGKVAILYPMAEHHMAERLNEHPNPTHRALMSARRLAAGEGWRVQDVVCTAGPQDRAFEERHGEIVIAAVTEGTFQYRSSLGAAVLTPGALMLGS